MELITTAGPVSHVGAQGGTSKFSIAMNGKAFRVLSDTMYQDKPGSIVREISCNALDGHTAKGIPERPFQIHLPDSFEPWFAVRDYGIGLTPDQVENVFCVYFASSKDQSNDAIGAFGLGAKTPFSYTDQFNVTSIVNGIMYAYSAVIGQDGTPSIILMAETPTDEESGVEVKIGIEEKDFKRFIDATRKQLRFFPVKPEIVNFNNGVFEFQPESEALFESDNVRIFKTGGYGERVHIVQGPVGYPLQVDQIRDHLTSDERAFLDVVTNIGGNMFFRIGEIGVTASREGVEYNAQTIASIKAKIAVALSEVKTWIETEISTLPNAYEKARFVNDNTAFRSIIAAVTLDLAPAEKNAAGTYSFSIGDCPAFEQDVSHTNAAGAVVTQKRQVITITEYTKGGISGVTTSRNSSSEATLHPTKNSRFAIVIRDSASKPVAKIRHYFKENNLERLFCLTATVDGFKYDAKFIKALKEQLGGFDTIELTSKMPDPPKTAYDRTRTNYSRPSAYQASTTGSEDLDSVANWTRVYDDLDELEDGGVYVTVERQRTENVSYETKRLYNDLCRAGVFDMTLYAIRENDVDKLAQTGANWVKLETYVQQKKAEVLSNPNIRRHSIAENVKTVLDSALGNRLEELAKTGKLHPRLPLSRLVKARSKAASIVENSNINSHMLRIAGYDSSNHGAVEAARKTVEKLYNGIPLARNIRNGYSNMEPAEIEHLVEYINHFGVK